MRNSIRLICFCMVLFQAVVCRAQDGRPIWNIHLNTNEIRGVAGDAGRLWIATGGGVVSFDPVSGMAC